MPKHIANSVYEKAQGKFLEYRHLLQHVNDKTRNQWQQAGINKFGRLMAVVGKTRRPEDYVKGTNSMRFIPKHHVPRNKVVTYTRFVASIREHNEEQHRVRLTAGGNCLSYDGKTSTETVSLETIKILWNSVLSTINA